MPGSLLREARKAAGMSVRELALAAGVHPRALERAETRTMRPATFRRYVEALLEELERRYETVGLVLTCPMPAA